MNDNVDNALDALIAKRLGERQRKLDLIGQFETDAAAIAPRRRYYWYAAAAVIAIVLAVAPMLHRTDISGIQISEPQFEEFRGTGESGIEVALSASDYAEALKLAEDGLADCNEELQRMADAVSSEDEYLIALARLRADELLWAKIYIYVKLNRRSEAKSALQLYVETGKDPDRKAEAEKILEII